MVAIRKADPKLMDQKPERGASSKALTPAAIAREGQNKQFRRMIEQLDSADSVFEIRLDPDEKPITIRQRLLRVAEDSKTEIAVRKHGSGFLVGLLTPDRRTNRGRRSKKGAAAS